MKLEKAEWRPSIAQESVITLLMTERLTIGEACEKSGISRPAYYTWFKNDNFVKWYDRQRAIHIKSNLTDIDKNMVNVAKGKEKNNVSAARLIYEKVGEISKERDGQTLTVIFPGLKEMMDLIPEPVKVEDVTDVQAIEEKPQNIPQK